MLYIKLGSVQFIMTEYYELKMNLLPSVLAQYNEKKKLYENIIPKFLIKTFNLIEQMSTPVIKCWKTPI